MRKIDYASSVCKIYESGNATEHSYREALIKLVSTIDRQINALNEPKRQQCGAPDIVISKSQALVGYIETKDVTVDLSKESNSDQIQRYRESLSNLVLTNYIDFQWYVDGKLKAEVSAGKVKKGKIEFNKSTSEIQTLLTAFVQTEREFLVNPTRLAERMANMAKMIKEVILHSIQNGHHEKLIDQYQGFKSVLLYDLEYAQFADMYAQTICYGLFFARANCPDAAAFDRKTAASFLPKTTPFLRKFFNHITGHDLDDEPYCWVVDDLTEMLAKSDFQQIIRNSGFSNDPEESVIHFYETFLAKYDPELRQKRGVFYTPKQVVDYIVRSTDLVLKKSFGLSRGYADASKIRGADNEESTHKVLVLDPAAGSGTFLNAIVKKIRSEFRGAEGSWDTYVHDHLIPRLFGFEILMAPYAVSHMKLGIQLSELGYKFREEERLNIFLTNALEDTEKLTNLPPFSRWIAEEANAASKIKRELPILVVTGNPPYSNFGQLNQNQNILNLLEDYKKGLNERKVNLNDDFIKFIRWGQWRIQQTGTGVLAFITSHTYLEGITHRRMRESLLETFDKIYVYDLHGNSRKNETCPDGSRDENVFDIQQGVAIAFFIKEIPGKHNSSDCQVYRADLWGKREEKFKVLESQNLDSTEWHQLKPSSPNYFFCIESGSTPADYDSALPITEVFPVNTSGIQTKRDALVVHKSQKALKQVINDLKCLDPEDVRHKYDLKKDGRDWAIRWAKDDIVRSKGKYFKILYKPFDLRDSYFTGNSKGFLAYPRADITEHLIRDNLAICTMRQLAGVPDLCQSLITRHMIADRTLYSTHGTPYIFPLFLYEKSDRVIQFDSEWKTDSKGRRPNISRIFVELLEAQTGLKFKEVGDATSHGDFDAPMILYYVYCLLNAPIYQSRYGDRIQKDFPRVFIPESAELFIQMAKLGRVLAELDLQDRVPAGKAAFPISGSNQVDRYEFDSSKTNLGRVWINDTQYFEDVSPSVWSARVAGYEPAQKYLKDRKGDKLSSDEIDQYSSIVGILGSRMNTIFKINSTITTHGLWPFKGKVARKSDVTPKSLQKVTPLPTKTKFEQVLEKRLTLSAYAIRKLSDDPVLGRVKFAKLLYMMDQLQKSHDLKTEYVREAAGPLDQRAIYHEKYGIESLGTKYGILTVEAKRRGRYPFYKYNPGVDIDLFADRAKDLFPSDLKLLDKFLKHASKMEMEQLEILATIYSAWNDLKLKKKSDPVDDEIISDVRNNWSARKKNFSRDRLLKALRWMVAQGYVPVGKGKLTKKKARANDSEEFF